MPTKIRGPSLRLYKVNNRQQDEEDKKKREDTADTAQHSRSKSIHTQNHTHTHTHLHTYSALTPNASSGAFASQVFFVA